MRSTTGMANPRVETWSYADRIVENLELGVCVLSYEVTHILFANAPAKAFLAGFGEADSKFPPVLRKLVREALLRQRRVGEFWGAFPVTSPDQRVYYLRGKQLPGPEQALMVTFAPFVPRAHDLDRLLRERFDLSVREQQIVALIRANRSNAEIAEELGLALGTVKQYVHGIFTALQIKSRTELLLVVDRLTFAGPVARPEA